MSFYPHDGYVSRVFLTRVWRIIEAVDANIALKFEADWNSFWSLRYKIDCGVRHRQTVKARGVTSVDLGSYTDRVFQLYGRRVA